MTDRVFYDHALLARLRGEGWSWGDIAVAQYGGTVTSKQLRQAHSTWRKRGGLTETWASDDPAPGTVPEEGREMVRDVAGQTFRQMKSIEDVIEAFELDPKVWEVNTVTVGGSSWDQSVKDGTIASSVRITATFRRIRFAEDDAKEIWDDLLADFRERMAREPVLEAPMLILPSGTDPVLCEIAIHDPHMGMLAHGAEVGGVNQDLKTIVKDYRGAVEHLIGVSRIYPVARYLYIVGHDLGHVNQSNAGGKGGATKRGTEQDVDSRGYKIFTTTRRAVVEGIDAAALVAPVDAVLVPGNHDPDENYRMGEVLQAWYRNNPGVDVQYGPRKRKFYNFGDNTFMLTHGEELRRVRDSLPLIMADECPDEWWAAGKRGVREIHTGHNHIRLQGGYYPTADMQESRGIVTRSLPGLTATDAWHYEEGYSHRRAATLLVYKQSGGLVGLHEFNL